MPGPEDTTAPGRALPRRQDERELLQRERHVHDRRHVLLERAGVENAVVLHLGRVRRRDLEDADVHAAKLAQIGARRVLPGGGCRAAAKVSRVTSIRLRWWEAALSSCPRC